MVGALLDQPSWGAANHSHSTPSPKSLMARFRNRSNSGGELDINCVDPGASRRREV